MSKTIKQLAEELGVSKTAIRKRFTDDFKAKYVETNHDGSLLVNDEGCKLIAESLRKFPQTFWKPVKTLQTPCANFVETGENQGLQENNTVLIDQLSSKDKQIKALMEQLTAKDKQIESLTSSNASLTSAIQSLTNQQAYITEALKAAQALHAGTIQERLRDQESHEHEQDDSPVGNQVSDDVSSSETETNELSKKKRSFWDRLFGK